MKYMSKYWLTSNRTIRMKGKIALITGGATGIGRSTALLLGQKGAKVIVTDINEEEGKNTAEAIKEAGGAAIFYKLDVSSIKEIETVINQIIQKEGPIDFAVNNAGIGGKIAPIHEVKLENWNSMIAINLSSVMFCMQAEIKCMLVNGGGRIVNVSSMAGLSGIPGGASYAAAKHGVLGLTKSAAKEYGSLNIRVNAVCPGFIETAILDDVPKEILDISTKVLTPMKRLGKPEEVAATIAYLLCDDSSFINGHALPIDGGLNA
jgi:NAD(P)-dependent dehydrogenase (short-subunit alcohol dehydrogenase family)